MSAFVFFLLCVIWGSTWMAIKIGLSQAPPLYAASIRFVIAVLILTLIVRLRKLKYPKGFRNFLALGYPGIFMYCGSYAFVYFAERHISSAMTAVLFGAFPFFVALLSHSQLKAETIRGKAWIGLAFGFLGVALISYDSLQTSGQLFEGTLLTIAGALAAAYGLIVHKKKFGDVNIYVAANVQMLVGGVLLVLGALLFEDWRDFKVSPESVGSILYLAVFGTVVAFLGYYWLLTHTKAVTVSLIAFITPVVAILIGVLFFGESLSAMIFLGAAMILSGIVLVVRR
jgi:drug/metabolite transporter (DMT)-like permease